MNDMEQATTFFTMANSVKGVTQADYRRIMPCVEAVKSFARTTHKSIYIIDFYKRNFLYVSESPTLLCGLKASVMQEMGYDFFRTHVPEEEQPMLDSLNQAVYEVIYSVPAEHRCECMLSFNFHLRHDDRLILVNHKSTPMVLTKDGAIWLVMATVSISPHKTPGHIEFFQFYMRERLEYSLETGRWNNRTTIELRPEEQQVLILSAQGYTMKEISEQMLRSFDTVKFYRRQIFRKLGVQSVAEALTFATNYGLI